jgi:hypothetical protein
MTAEKDPIPRELIPPYPNHPYFRDGVQPLRVDGGAHAFQHGARDFEFVNAWWLAEAATLVYDREEFVAERFRGGGLPEVVLFDRAGTQCYVASNDHCAFVAFRGTESGARSLKELRQIVIDVEDDKHFLLAPSAAGGRVHRGFAGAVAAVWEGAGGLRSHLAGLAGSRSLWFTGHSLGAANATFAALLCAQSGLPVGGLYTYGSPRVGDAEFAAHFRTLFPGDSGRDYQRFANERDIVTLVPPEPFGYRHVGTGHHIESDGTINVAAAPPDATPAELAREVNGLLLNLIPGAVRRLVIPDVSALGLKLPASIETLIDGVIASLPHALLDRALLDHAPDPLKHHVPTMYSNRIWNEYIRTLP